MLLGLFFYLGGLVSCSVGNGAVVVYARWEEVWGAFLGVGGVDGQHGDDGREV